MQNVPAQPLRHPGGGPSEAAPDDERVTEYYLWRRKAAGPHWHRHTSRGLDRAPDFAPPCARKNPRRIVAGCILGALLAAAAFFAMR